MSGPAASPALCIGLMSGTSLDGVDGVLVDFAAQPPRVLASHGLPLPPGLRDELLALNASGPDELHRAAVAAHQLTQVYAEVVQALLAETGCPNVYERCDDLIRKGEGLPLFSGALAGDEPPEHVLVVEGNQRYSMDLCTGFKYPKLRS